MPISTSISQAERTLEEMLTDLTLFSDKNVDLSSLPRVTPSSDPFGIGWFERKIGSCY